MTSLCPGPLFATPGLNQYSTPSSRTSTPSDIEKRFTRVPFNGIPWPKQSPVSRVYDVRNSSTKMILLNNKYTRKGCRLRGQTMNDGQIKAPDPKRHSGETPYVNRKSHTDCLTSTTPVFQPEVKTSLKWANKTQRPPLKFEDGSSVNYKRHTACMTTEDLRMMNWQRPRRPYSTSIVRESQQCNNPLLDDLNPGERLYLYSIARVYSVDSMRRLKQNQYCQLLQKEGQRGGYSAEEYRRYMKYLSSQRKTQHGATDTYQRQRIRSAPSNRDTQTDKTGTPSEQSQSRPASTKSKSRSTSRPLSRASLASNKSNKKKAQEMPKSKSDTKPSKQASDGASATNKKSPDTKTSKESTNKTAASSKTSSDRQPAKSSSEHAKPQKNTPEHEKSKTNASDNSKMAETENTDKKVSVIQIQEQNQDEEPDEDEAQVRGEDMVKDSDDAEDQMAHQHRGKSHKEGVDRPKSRLGERPRAKDNSDDDYSSDSETDSSSSDESEPETSKSQTRSEPSKTSSSSQKAGSEAASPGSPPKPEVVTTPSTPPRSEISKTEGSPPKDGDHDASYSEDFSEASQSVSKSQASKTDDNKRQSDSSTSEKSSDKSQLKPSPVSESKGQSSSGSESDTSSSLKPAQQATLSSDTPTTDDTSTSTSEPQVKVSQDDTKVNQGDTNVSQDKDKVSDESYSEDFTESSSKSQSGDRAKGEKSPEVKVKGERPEVTFKEEVHNSSQNTTELNEDTGDKSNRGEEPYQRERRDSIEMDREGRVKDWDKIEY